MSIDQDDAGKSWLKIGVAEIGAIGSLIAILAAATSWIVLPYRLEQAEVHLREQATQIDQMRDIANVRNEKLAILITTVDSINERTKRIESKLP